MSVAEELVVEPAILYSTSPREPTPNPNPWSILFPLLMFPRTGLDSTTAMSIVRTLCDIARRGTTILLSIHQPRYPYPRKTFQLHFLDIQSCIRREPQPRSFP